MREFEVMIEIINACAGNCHPDTTIEEIEVNDPDDYVREKHGADFEKMQKEVLESGEIQYTLSGEAMVYRYTFTEF